MKLKSLLVSLSLLHSQLALAAPLSSVDSLQTRQLPAYCSSSETTEYPGVCAELQEILNKESASGLSELVNFGQDFSANTFGQDLKEYSLAKLLEKRYRNMKLFPDINMNLVDSKFKGCFKDGPLKKYSDQLENDIKSSQGSNDDQLDFLAGVMMNTLRAEAGWSNRKETNKKMESLIKEREKRSVCLKNAISLQSGAVGLKTDCQAKGLTHSKLSKVKEYWQAKTDHINEQLQELQGERKYFNDTVLNDPLLVDSTSWYQKGDFKRTPLMNAVLGIFDQQEKEALGANAPKQEILGFMDWSFSKFDEATNRNTDKSRSSHNLVTQMRGFFLSKTLGEDARKRSTESLSAMVNVSNDDNTPLANALRAYALKDTLKEYLKKNPSKVKELKKVAKEQMISQADKTAEAMEEICDEDGENLHHYQSLADELKRDGVLKAKQEGRSPEEFLRQFNKTHCYKHEKEPIESTNMSPLLVGAGLFVGAGVCVLGAAFTFGGSCAAAGALMAAGGAVFAGYGVYEAVGANQKADIGLGLSQINLADMDKVRKDISEYRAAMAFVGVDVAAAPFAVLTGGTKAVRVMRAQSTLGRKLSPEEADAVWRAHKVGQGEKGADGSPAKLGNYTQEQINEKARILAGAISDKKERRKLMEAGIAGGADNPYADFITSLTKKAENGEEMSPEDVAKFREYQDWVAGKNPAKAQPSSPAPEAVAAKPTPSTNMQGAIPLKESSESIDDIVARMTNMAAKSSDDTVETAIDISSFVSDRVATITRNADRMLDDKGLTADRTTKLVRKLEQEIAYAKENGVSGERLKKLEQMKDRAERMDKALKNDMLIQAEQEAKRYAREQQYISSRSIEAKEMTPEEYAEFRRLEQEKIAQENEAIKGLVPQAQDASPEDIALYKRIQDEKAAAEKAAKERKIAQEQEAVQKQKETEEARAEFERLRREYDQKQAAKRAEEAEQRVMAEAQDATEGLPETYTKAYAERLRRGTSSLSTRDYVDFSQKNKSVFKNILERCSQYVRGQEACIDILIYKTMTRSN